MITQIPNCINGARTLLSTTIKKYERGQLASFSRLAYPCNQANEKKKKYFFDGFSQKNIFKNIFFLSLYLLDNLVMFRCSKM